MLSRFEPEVTLMMRPRAVRNRGQEGLCAEDAPVDAGVDGFSQFVHRREFQWPRTAGAGGADKSIETVFATQVTDDGRRGEDLLPVCDIGQDTLERTARGGFQVVGICL